MRKPILAVAILAVAITPAFAQAGGQTPSEIIFEGSDTSSLGLIFYGIVDSPKNKCRKGRTVELYNRGKDGSVLHVVDTDTTSDRGAWSVIFTKGDDPNNLWVRVLKSEAGSTKCGASKIPILF
jgi:hypothetical protein